jgi:hypothetical protein
MIETENAANDRSVNSLINFETVKFFGMERRECCLLEEFIVKYNKVFLFIIYNFLAWNEGRTVSWRISSSLTASFFFCISIYYFSAQNVRRVVLSPGRFHRFLQQGLLFFILFFSACILRLFLQFAWPWTLLYRRCAYDAQAFVLLKSFFRLLKSFY